MKYNFMDKELIDINGIKNLEYIRFYDLTMNKDNKRIIVPSLMINYDNGKMLNLSIMDKYFNQFVQKVIVVYQEEKDKQLENSETDPFDMFREISIDERSKKIIDNANIIQKKVITSFYDDKDNYDNSLLFQTDEVKSIIDIVRFSIYFFSKFADINVSLSDKYYGYRENYIIESTINDIFTYLLIHYDRVGDNTYQISVGNIGGTTRPYIININFYDNMITINSKYQNITLNNEFKLDAKGGHYLYYAYRDGNSVLYEIGDLPSIDMPYSNIVNLDYDTNLTWYKLPWEAYFGINSSLTLIDEYTKIITNHIMYLDINSDNFNKREYYTKKLEREKTVSQRRIKLTLDELRKITFGFKLNDIFLIETSFKNARGDGAYQNKFNGKYFYHLTSVDTIKNIDKNNLIPVTKNIIIQKNDVLNKSKIKKLGGK